MIPAVIIMLIAARTGICFYKAWKSAPYDRLPYAFQGFLWLMMAGGPFLAEWMGQRELAGTFRMLPMLGALLHDALWVRRKYERCVYLVEARYLGCRKVSGKSYRPHFSYTYEGRVLEEESFVGYSWGLKNQLFEESGICTVYIDPDRPTHCVDKRTPLYDWNIYVLVGLAVLFGVSALLGNPLI